jgi:hypothetical protein
VYGKFGALTNDSNLIAQPDDICKVFQIMEEITLKELKQLKERNDENPIEPDDTFIDFATEEFITKNIRVRPISGVTHGDETKDGRQSNVSKGGENEEDKVEKEHFEAIIELNEQREKIKKKIEAYKEEKRKKQLQEEKKANKK